MSSSDSYREESFRKFPLNQHNKVVLKHKQQLQQKGMHLFKNTFHRCILAVKTLIIARHCFLVGEGVRILFPTLMKLY